MDAIKKLKYGEVEPIFEPGKRTSYKDGYTLRVLRGEALRTSHFLYGTGLTMSAARSRVAAALGETTENIRNWDRALKKELEAQYERAIPYLDDVLKKELEAKYKSRTPYLNHFADVQFFGAMAAGLGRDVSLKRLKIPLDWDTDGSVWALVNELHNRGLGHWVGWMMRNLLSWAKNTSEP